MAPRQGGPGRPRRRAPRRGRPRVLRRSRHHPALRAARRRLEPRGPGRAAQPEVAAGVEAGGVRGPGHVHRRRLLLRQRGRHRDLLARRHLLRLARHLRHGLGARARRAHAQGRASARRCASPCRATTSGSRPTPRSGSGSSPRSCQRDELWDRTPTTSPPASPPSRTAATQGTVRAIWESLDRPYRAAMQQGLIYTRVGNPHRHGRGRRAPGPPARAEATVTDADQPSGLARRIAGRPRHRPERAGGRVRRRLVLVGRRSLAPPSSSRRSVDVPGAQVGVILRNRPSSVGRAARRARGRRLRRRHQPRTRASSGPGTTSPTSGSRRSSASRTTSALVDPGLGATDRRRRATSVTRSTSPAAPAPSRADPRPATAVRMLTSGTTGTAEADRPHHRHARTGAGRGEALRVERGQRPPAASGRRGGERAARPPRRPVPRPPVRRRRPIVLPARAVHGRRAGTTPCAGTAPRPRASSRRRSAWCSRPTSTRPT